MIHILCLSTSMCVDSSLEYWIVISDRNLIHLSSVDRNGRCSKCQYGSRSWVSVVLKSLIDSFYSAERKFSKMDLWLVGHSIWTKIASRGSDRNPTSLISKTSYDRSSVHSPLLAVTMSAPPEFPDNALSLRNELLLLLLDLRYKKNGICSMDNSAEFRRNLCNEFLAGLVCFSFSLPWHC